MKKILLLLLFILNTSGLWAQHIGIPSQGREYFIGLIPPSFNYYTTPDILAYYGKYIFISSPNATVVKISYYDSDGHESIPDTFTVAANTSIQIPLQLPVPKTQPKGDTIEFTSCHVVCSAPATVEFFSKGACAGGSYLALPVQCWGQNYVVMSYHDNPGGVGGILTHENSSGACEILGAYDNTLVTVTPVSTTRGGHPGLFCGKNAGGGSASKAYTILLKRGQTYTIYSAGLDPGCDLSGSTITSTKPIAVLAGHENALSDSGSVGFTVEERNYMIEQLLPVEMWDTTGYLSIPMFDAKGGIGGEGDEYKLFYGGGGSTGLGKPTASIISDPGAFQFSISPYQFPVPSFVTETPRHSFSLQSAQFAEMQYDQRMQASTGIAPAPEMMSVVPFSRWLTSYSIFIPGDTLYTSQGHFVGVICRNVDYQKDSILILVDGGKAAPIRKSGLSQQKQFSMPDYPAYIGVVLKIPGNTSLQFKSITFGDDNMQYEPFMVYSYGFQSFNPSKPVGSFDGKDFFYEYAHPAGCSYINPSIDTSNLSASVQALCNGWRICVNSTTLKGNGIRYVELLNYPFLIHTGRDQHITHSGYNIEIDRSIDPLQKGDIILPGTDSSFCFTVYRKNALDTSHLAVAIYDNAGNEIIVEASTLGIFSDAANGDLHNQNANTYYFTATPKDSTHCGILTLRSADKTNTIFTTIDSIYLKSGNSGISISATLPQLPFTLNTNSSFAIPLCIHADGSLQYSDTLIIVTSCGFVRKIGLTAQGLYARLSVADASYGEVLVDNTLCKTISFTNTGTAPVVIRSLSLSDTTNFWIANINQSLPATLNPGGILTVTCCFHPGELKEYSAVLSVSTDLSSDDLQISKIISALEGKGGKVTLSWIPTEADFILDSSAIGDSFKVLVLKNTSAFAATVTHVNIIGKDSEEFNIISTQNGRVDNYNLPAHDSNWYKLVFQPDLTKPSPATFAERIATLRCQYFAIPAENLLDTTDALLKGSFTGPSIVKSKEGEDGFAYIDGPNIEVILPRTDGTQFDAILYDLLGKEVSHWNQAPIESKLHLLLPDLPTGIYILVVYSGYEQYRYKVQLLKN